MASAWGSSFGVAWGDSWGAVTPAPTPESTPEPSTPTGGGGGGGSGRLGSGIYKPIKLRPRVRFKDKRYDDYAVQIDDEDAVIAMMVMRQ